MAEPVTTGSDPKPQRDLLLIAASKTMMMVNNARQPAQEYAKNAVQQKEQELEDIVSRALRPKGA